VRGQPVQAGSRRNGDSDRSAATPTEGDTLAQHAKPGAAGSTVALPNPVPASPEAQPLQPATSKTPGQIVRLDAFRKK